MDKNEVITRLTRLQNKMNEYDLDYMLITQNVDLYYFTGTMQTGYLIVPSQGEAMLYVRRSIARALDESFVTVKPLGSFREFGATIISHFPQIEQSSEVMFGTEFDVLPVQTYERLQKAIPFAKWIDGSTIVREVRMLKSPYEVEQIKLAAKAVDEALKQSLTTLREGMTELELVSQIEQRLRMSGHMGIMRMRGYNQELITGMIASGASAAAPTYFDGPAGGSGLGPASPQSAGRHAIVKNEPILLDVGCTINGYVVDQTRTAVIGQLTDELLRAYETAENILRSIEDLLVPGTICEDIYLHALKLASEAELSAHFMGWGADQVKFVGHGIGLEIDEFPVLAKGFKYPLQPGMVIAIEPKFTFPNQGVVGIENTYLITDDGFETLTCSKEELIRL